LINRASCAKPHRRFSDVREGQERRDLTSVESGSTGGRFTLQTYFSMF
jgi:hypothetical protein